MNEVDLRNPALAMKYERCLQNKLLKFNILDLTCTENCAFPGVAPVNGQSIATTNIFVPIDVGAGCVDRSVQA